MSKLLESIDPNDTSRQLLPFEQWLFNMHYRVLAVQGVKKGVEPGKLQDAMELVYQWYPTIAMTGTDPVNCISRYTTGPIKYPKFLEDVKNNKVIRSNRDLYEIIAERYRDLNHDKKHVFESQLYKVDIRHSEEGAEGFLGPTHGHLLFTGTYHTVFDGKSQQAFSKVINNYIRDATYKPDIEKPQVMPNNLYALVPKGTKMTPLDYGSGNIGTLMYHERALKTNPDDRGITLEARAVPKSALARLPGCSFNAGTTAVQALIFNTLLLDYHEGESEVSQSYGNPYAVDHSKFDRLMEGDSSLLVGNDVTGMQMYLKARRDREESVYSILREITPKLDFARENRNTLLINSNLLPYSPGVTDHNKFTTVTRWSNFGASQFEAGAIDRYHCFGLDIHDVGSINIVTVGQPDGSIIFSAMCQEVCYSREFVRRYMDLFLDIYRVAGQRDVGRAELRQHPTYRWLLGRLQSGNP